MNCEIDKWIGFQIERILFQKEYGSQPKIISCNNGMEPLSHKMVFMDPHSIRGTLPPFLLLVENLFCTKGNYKFINQSFCQVLYVWKEKRGKNGRRELLIQDTTIYLKRYLTAITNNFTCYNTRPLLLF